ncbi:hypothetical protein DV736_g6349, partial [Chaetothyriales sp. CBS 134916]
MQQQYSVYGIPSFNRYPSLNRYGPGDDVVFVPPTDGLSLLDAKNSLLLSYLQSLVFLLLVQLRHVQGEEADVTSISTAVQQKLTELRIYLDRGVRPIEGRLKYQIDSALRAADMSKREAHAKATPRVTATNDSDDASDSDDNESVLQEDDNALEKGLLYRPNLTIPKGERQQPRERSLDYNSSAVYKPPRMNATAMPDPDKRDRNRSHEPWKRKSQLLNEYIDEELSSAPRAQPSIGSNNTILDSGRGGLSQRDREKDHERTVYEEGNFTRLPAQTKKERRESRRKGQLGSRDVFGGEDWTGLGGLGDRVSRSVSMGRRDKESVLKRREKRMATEDSVRSDGTAMGIGNSFEKRRRVLEARVERRAVKKR